MKDKKRYRKRKRQKKIVCRVKINFLVVENPKIKFQPMANWKRQDDRNNKVALLMKHEKRESENVRL